MNGKIVLLLSIALTLLIVHWMRREPPAKSELGGRLAMGLFLIWPISTLVIVVILEVLGFNLL